MREKTPEVPEWVSDFARTSPYAYETLVRYRGAVLDAMEPYPNERSCEKLMRVALVVGASREELAALVRKYQPEPTP